ncbi:phenylacetate--CoA ligase family protein [Gammaproteobacteria bacterium AH-315-C21]|nr:phenylacetate--CoA ligase family protein [Gammaproteobacteria bacterium AH-315-C21]
MSTDTNIKAYRHFLETPIDALLEKTDNDAHLAPLFQQAANEVPAYSDFLRQHGFSGTIYNRTDFATLPLTTKDNYMRAYPLAQRCRHGRLDQCEMIAVSSGSTGQPMFWPRSIRHELDIATRFEQVLHDSFAAHSRSTLVIVCFALGNWVGGIYTANCVRLVAQKGYALTLLTPGSNIDEIFRIVRELSPSFEQTVFAGYPPFIKSLLDRGRSEDIDWPSYHLRFIFAGEVFSEEWRQLLMTYSGSSQPCHDSASLYGTADAGVLGNETPLSIGIRRFFAENPNAARDVFGESRLPALMQYDPVSRYFETHDDTLVVSGDNGVPLLRYHIADRGGIFSYDELIQIVNNYGCDIDTSEARHLPFVYLFGRADFTVSYFGANIYPENIMVALEQTPISEWVSGKFVLEVDDDSLLDKKLCLAVELLPQIATNAINTATIATAVISQLQRLNSEFNAYVPLAQQKIDVTLWPHGHPNYFPAGVKHRYSRR